ncbi:sigma 54-interacting transcriptional regulator [Endothiovibrio diazotrophicus]
MNADTAYGFAYRSGYHRLSLHHRESAAMSLSRILIVDDSPGNIQLLSGMLEARHEVLFATGGEQALEIVARRPVDLVLLDVMMPGMDGYELCRRLRAGAATADIPVLFMSALTDTVDKVTGFEAGGVDYLTKPVERAELLARIEIHLTLRRQRLDLESRNAELARLNRELEEEMARRHRAEESLEVTGARLSALSEREAKRWGVAAFIGRSPLLLRILDEIRRLHRADRTNVVVLGESGTGKELVARALHFGSGRSAGPFVPVNCSAIPHDLADSAFFGHLKGSFTGALDNRKGWFEQADGGTLFLDELGDMPLTLQAKLLRVLEDGEVTPVGGAKSRRIDVRVIAATNVDLELAVEERAFRRDLYFRLAGYVVRLPPLRERLDDIPLLAEHFLKLLGEEMGVAEPRVSGEAMAAMQAYRFPGNIRELKNLMEFALISSGGAPIQSRHLHFIDAPAPRPPLPPTAPVAEAYRAPATGSLPAIPASGVDMSGFGAPAGFGGGEQDEARILDHLAQVGRITNRDCQALLGVAHQRASYLLKKLHREGRLVREGERRWAFYRLP